MKSIKDLREANEKEFKARLPEITISESVIAEEETDDVSSVLLALNHLATMTDDLYTVIGDEDIKIDGDEIVAILNAYDVISEIYDKYEGMVSMPSREYDIDALDVEVMESIEEDLLALDEAVSGEDNPLHHGVSAKALDTLEKLGFRGAPVGPNTWKPSQKVLKMWGIPMRAGKFADVFFASLDVNDGESRQFAIADADGVEKYKDLDKAIASLKKKAKMNESVEELEEGITVKKVTYNWGKLITVFKDNDFSIVIHPEDQKKLQKLKTGQSVSFTDETGKTWNVQLIDKKLSFRANNSSSHIAVDRSQLFEAAEELEETPGGPSALQKIDAAIAGFKKKLDSGKYPDSEADLKKILARLEAQKKALTPKKEDVELDEGNLIDMTGVTCKVCKKGKYKETSTHDDIDGVLHCDKCNHKIKRWFNEIPTSKTSGGKKILKVLGRGGKMESTELQEAEMKIVSWKHSKGINDPFRMEVVGQNGSEVSKILDKVLPSAKFNLYGDDLGFKSVGEREAAAKALVKFYKTIKEQDCSEMDLSVIAEEFDETKFRRLAVTGLVPEGDVAKIIMAMKRLDSGKELTKDQKDLVTSTFHSLIGMVTGDMSVFTKIQNKLKKD